MEKSKRPPWQVHGTPVLGYWAYWPASVHRHLKRFERLEDAIAWIPVDSKNKGRKLPLGEKRILRVTYGDAFTKWTYDIVKVFSQDEVDEMFLKMAAEVAEQ